MARGAAGGDRTPARTAGFRCSTADGAVVAATAVATALLEPRLGDAAWLLPLVVGHFFVFCNVFRVRRSYELAWVAVFLANTLWHGARGEIHWAIYLGAQLPVTAAVLLLELTSPRYHGVGARWINRAYLDAWLAGHLR